MEKRKVLVVGPLPPPVGGVETVTKAVLESGIRKDFRIAHCDLTKGRDKTTQGKFDLGNLRWACIHFGRMLNAMGRFRPDAVYMALTATWSGFLRDAVIASIARLGGAKVVGHVHGGWFDRILARRGLGGLLVRAALGRFDALLVLGTRWRADVERYGFRGTCLVVPSTFRAEIAESAASFTRDYDVRDPVALFVGQIGHGKGVADLLMALHLVRTRGTPLRLVLAGPGQFGGDLDSCKRLARELKLGEAVTFTGPLQGEALFAQYRNADFFVLPSHYEGLPVVFFEAGAFGLPVIGTPVGAIPDLLKHEMNALLVQPRDVRGLAASLERLYGSAEERRLLGAQLKEDVRGYAPEAVCRRISAAVRLVLDQPADMEDPETAEAR